MTEYDAITLPEDTLIHINGLPFMLKAGSVVLGRHANFALAREMRELPQTSEAPK